MHYFNCGCGTVRPQRPAETIYTLYLLVNEDADENNMIIDLYIPGPGPAPGGGLAILLRAQLNKQRVCEQQKASPSWCHFHRNVQ